MSHSDTPSKDPEAPSKGRSFLLGSHRWGRRVFSTLIVVAAVLLVGLIFLWSAGGAYIAEKVTAYVNARVLDAHSTLEIEDVGGSLVHQVVVGGMRLDRRGPAGSIPFAAARRIQVTYDLWGVLHGRYAASRVEVDGLRMELRADSTGGFFIPGARKSQDGGGGAAPRLWIRNLVLTDAALVIDLPWRVLELDSVYARVSITSGREGLRIDVKGLTGRLGDGLGLLEIEDGRIVAADSVWLQDVTGHWEGTPFRVDGTLLNAPVDLDLALSEFPLERLGRLLVEDGLDPGVVHTLEGNITSRGGGTSFHWKGAGRWDTWEITGLEGRGQVIDDEVRLTDTQGQTEGGRFSEARITIPLNASSLTIEGVFDQLRIQTLRVESLEDYPGTVSGSGTVKIRDRKNWDQSVQARLQLNQGQLLEVPFLDAWISGTIQNTVWHLDSVHVNLANARVRGHGSFGPESMDLSFEYLGDLRPWRQFLQREELEGRGELRVDLQGPSERPVLRARGGLADLKVATIRAKRVELQNAEGVVGATPNLSLAFIAPEGISVSETPFSRAQGSVVVTADRILMQELRLERGDTTVTGAGELRWEPYVQVHMEEAELLMDGRRFWLAEPGDLSFDTDVLASPGIRVRTPRGSFQVQGDWNIESNRVDATVGVNGLDPSVFFPSGSPPPVAVGKIWGSMGLVGTAPDFNGSLDLAVREMDWKGVQEGHIDSATIRLSLEDRTVTVDRLEALVGSGKIVISGDMTLPQNLSQTIQALRDSIPIDPEATRWNLSAEATDLKLPQWRFLIPERGRATGTVNATVGLSGTSAAPILEVHGEGTDLIWKQFDAKQVVLAARLHGGTLQVDTLWTRQDEKLVEATGTFPLDLSIYPFSWAVPERPQDIRIRAEDGSLHSLRLTPWIQKASGSLKAEARFQGTPRSPLVLGWARVEDGEFVLEDRDELLTEVTALIRFDRDLIRVEEAKGKMILPWNPESGRNSEVTASGTYRLGAEEEETYALTVRFKDALAGEEGIYAARVSGEVKITPLRASDGKIYPFAKGVIDVSRAEYAGSLEPQDIGEFKPPAMLYDVVLNAPRKVFIRTEKVDAELGGEDLVVRQTPERQEIVGELEILRGTYQFFQKTFRVTEGTLLWNDPANRLPEMDIRAQASEAGYLIIVELTGRVGKPSVMFLAQRDGVDAGLTEGEILRIITVGATGLGALGISSGVETEDDATDPSGTGKAAIAVGNLFLDQIERQLAHQIGLVDEVQLETEGREGDFEPIVGVKKYVTPNLNIQYRQGLGNSLQQDLEVEYRLGRIIFLRGVMIRRLEGGSKDQEYNLDLKVRREY